MLQLAQSFFRFTTLPTTLQQAKITNNDRSFLFLPHPLHQVQDALKLAVSFRALCPLLLKLAADVPHDLGLLLVPPVVLWVQAGLIGLQPVRVLLHQ